jgi:NAD(P)-dependent dehydrogenase (short-subunit alcohol dehydrogenase family)
MYILVDWAAAAPRWRTDCRVHMNQNDRRVALVTGANKGIGFEVARQLGEAGFYVLLGARDINRGIAATTTLESEGHCVRFEHLDVADESSVAAAATRIGNSPGRLDVLVNNAGILSDGEFNGLNEFGEPIVTPPSHVALQVMRSTYETNIFGAVAVTNAMLPFIRCSPAGRIVNVSSRLGGFAMAQRYCLSGNTEHYLNLLAYNSSKAALNHVTLQYAIELRETCVKVNSADPGHCATDINGRLGDRPPSEAARIIVQLATLPESGPTGAFIGEDGPRAW